MLPVDISPIEIEKALLHFLSLAQIESSEDHLLPAVPFKNEELIFHELDLVQERGRLPVLQLVFILGQCRLEVEFYGHISPIKFSRYGLYKDGNMLKEHTFSSPGKLYHSDLMDEMVDLFPDSIDGRALLTSLYLWRACTGLGRICPEDLRKYFSKMKSVSRYEWKIEYITIDGSIVDEKWIVNCFDQKGGGNELHVVLKNGVVVEVDV